MKELSLHILDLVQNSITAGASEVIINIDEDIGRDTLTIEIIDNGKGMSQEFVDRVTSPFVTSRNTRKVGLGISLTKAAAELCEGNLNIESELDKGTKITANFKYNHIDRMPIGDMSETIVSIICANPQCDIVYNHIVNNKKFEFGTKQIREQIQGIEINDIEILSWIKEYITEGIEEVFE